MTRVFIGGSRRISRLAPDVTRRIDTMIERRLAILVGDANGADRAVQEYLLGKDYDLVEVYCAGGACRNNVGAWPVHDTPVLNRPRRKDFSFYALKDRAMADEADVGLMLWDRASVGTLMNVRRLLRRRKKVVVYLAPDRAFVDLAGDADFEKLVASCPPAVRNRLHEKEAGEERSEAEPRQASLL